MYLFKLSLLFLGGIAAGFINIMAGGGSIMTLPLLIFLGLPSSVANGTNRIGILFQSSIGAVKFHRKKLFDHKFAFILVIPMILGAIVGSSFAIDLPDEIFKKVLAVVIIVVLVLVILRPQKYIKDKDENITLTRKIISIIAFFFVGIYSGFIQAGVGFIIIATLSMTTNFSLLRINGVKLFIIAVSMIITLVVFAINGKIEIIPGLVLAGGNSIGAWIGSNVAIKNGDKIIKIVFAIAVIGMAIKLMFF